MEVEEGVSPDSRVSEMTEKHTTKRRKQIDKEIWKRCWLAQNSKEFGISQCGISTCVCEF